jgi:hypothetical protein
VQVDLRSDLISEMSEFGVCNNIRPGIDLLADNYLFFSDVQCVVTRSQAVAAECLAAKQQVSVSDRVVIDSNEVQFSGNVDTAPSHTSQTGNGSQANQLLLNDDIKTVPIDSIFDRNNFSKPQQADNDVFLENLR